MKEERKKGKRRGRREERRGRGKRREGRDGRGDGGRRGRKGERRGEGDRKSKEETSSSWCVHLNLAIMRSSGQHLTVSTEGHTQH